jgi:hypothetical protein
MPQGHVRWFDDVVVDAHQDQIVDLHAGILCGSGWRRAGLLT